MYFVQRGGGGQTPNPNFLDFILVELLNLVTEKFNPIFVQTLGWRGGLKNFGRNTYFHFFFLMMTSLRINSKIRN